MPEDERQLPAARRASELFCQKILQRRFVQHRVGQQALELGVLALELLEPPGIRHLQPTILRLPVVDRRFRYTISTGQIGGLRSSFGLLKQANDLLFGEPQSLRLVRPSNRAGLSSRSEENQGATSHSATASQLHSMQAFRPTFALPYDGTPHFARTTAKLQIVVSNASEMASPRKT